MARHSGQGYTLLILAAKLGHLDVVKCLIKRGADVNKKDTRSRYKMPWVQWSRAPVHYACINGSRAMVKALLRAGATADGICLKNAARAGNADILRLLARRMDVSERVDRPGNSPLALAAASGNEDALYVLIRAVPSKVDELLKRDGKPAMKAALEQLHEGMVKLLVEFGVEPHKFQWPIRRSPLHLLIDQRKNAKKAANLVRLLIETRPTPLKRRKFANQIDGDGRSPLHAAVANGQRAVVEVLLEFEADANAAGPGGTPLFVAVLKKPELTQLLVDGGADANAKGEHGRTLLHYSAKSVAGVESVLQLGADAGAQDDRGRTALFESSAETVPLLVEAGADVNVADTTGLSPLLFAVRSDRAKAKALLCAGADPNAADQHGHTALHYAIRQNDLRMAHTLLKDHGAKAYLLDNDGKSPEEYVRVMWNTDQTLLAEVRRLMEKAKANVGKTVKAARPRN